MLLLPILHYTKKLDLHYLFSVTTCSGICMAERIADYCDAVLMIETLCKSGYKCCVSRDAFGDSPPPELLVIDRLNSSRYDEKNDSGAFSEVSSSSTIMKSNISTVSAIATMITNTTTTTMMTTKQPSTITMTTRPTLKPCKGKCTNVLSALFCDNIDGDADCPADGSVLTVCCVNESSSQKTVIKFNI